jgi:hypothetical protein
MPAISDSEKYLNPLQFDHISELEPVSILFFRAFRDATTASVLCSRVQVEKSACACTEPQA